MSVVSSSASLRPTASSSPRLPSRDFSLSAARRPLSGASRASRALLKLPELKVDRQLIIRAKGKDWSDEDDAEFEARLAALKTAKGATPMGQTRKDSGTKDKSSEKPAYVPKTYSFEDEELYYEGPPARGDLAINVALGATILWLPLTIAALGRGAFVKYRFTNKRFSVETNAPWQKEKTDVAYQEVSKVVSIPRGVGLWGDMVVTLKNGDKVELRALDRFKELEKYILQRRGELTGKP